MVGWVATAPTTTRIRSRIHGRPRHRCAGLAAAIGDAVGVKGVGADVRSSPCGSPIRARQTPTGSPRARSLRGRSTGAGRMARGSSATAGAVGCRQNAVVAAFERRGHGAATARASVDVVIAAGNERTRFFPRHFPMSSRSPRQRGRARSSRAKPAGRRRLLGSCFGLEVVSIAAPGVHNYTIDIAGSAATIRRDYMATVHRTWDVLRDAAGRWRLRPILGGQISGKIRCEKLIVEIR